MRLFHRLARTIPRSATSTARRSTDAARSTRVSPPDQPGTHSYEMSKDGRWAFHTYSRFGQPPVIELVRLPEHKVVRVLADNASLRGQAGGT